MFGVGLVGDKVQLNGWAKGFLISSWVLIFVSIAAGILSYSRIPTLLANENYNIQDKYFEYPGRVHQIAFGFGVFFLATSLIIVLSTPSFKLVQYQVPSAVQAVDRVKTNLPEGLSLKKFSKVELVKGIEESRPNSPVWYVQFEGELTKDNQISTSSFDFFVDAKTGEVRRIP